jgi:hypothetical protein
MSDIVSGPTSFKLSNELGRSVVLSVEPWADEFNLPNGSTFELVTNGGVRTKPVTVELTDEVVTIWVNSGVVMAAEIDGTDVWPYAQNDSP